MNKMNKRIPITAAQRVAKDYGYDIGFVIGLTPGGGYSVATYGKNRKFCNWAAILGNLLLTQVLLKDYDNDPLAKTLGQETARRLGLLK